MLAVIRAADLTEALRIANGTDYALTGGIYSPQPGAPRPRPGASSWSATCISTAPSPAPSSAGSRSAASRCRGIGSKAGGRDYLLQFVLPRTITENTIRRGFAPPEGE